MRTTPNWVRNTGVVVFDCVRNVGRPVTSEVHAPLIRHLVIYDGYDLSGVMRWLEKLQSMFFICILFVYVVIKPWLVLYSPHITKHCSKANGEA